MFANKCEEEQELEGVEITDDVRRYINYAYLRTRDRHRVGVLLAYAPPKEEYVKFALSLCITPDIFDPVIGRKLAEDKLASGRYVAIDVGELRYVLTSAGVREQDGAYKMLAERTTDAYQHLIMSVASEAGVSHEGWKHAGVSMEQHATTIANVVKWAMQGKK